MGFKLRTFLSLVAAAVAASAVTLAAVAVGAARPVLPWARPGPCTVVDVVASSEKAALMSSMAGDFDRAGQPAGGCVRVQVHSMDSGAAERALARGWDAGRDSGTGAPFLPTAWTPAASSWLLLLDEADTERGRPLQHLDYSTRYVTSTPLVLAMPQPMAEALGWPNRPIGWEDILALTGRREGWASLGHPEWGQFRLGKTDPDLSTSGLHALIETYFAATGSTLGLTPDAVESTQAVGYVTGIEQAAVHYSNTTLTFLANLQAADDAGQALSYISAVAVEEKSVWDYNHGNPSGDPRTLGSHRAPAVPLVAIYPKEGTLFSDSPYAVLKEPWVTRAQQAAAGEFFEYLHDPARQQQFEDVGFRDASGRAPDGAHDQIVEANGLLPLQPQAAAPPQANVLAQIQADWHRVRKRARLLVVLDTSRAMDDPVPGGGGASRFDLARRAVLATLADLSPDDEIGLAAFPGAGAAPLRTLVGVAPVARVGELVRATAFGRREPAPTSPLSGAVAQAVSTMSAPGSYDPSRINAVLLLATGSDDASTGVGEGEVLNRLQATDEAHNVPVFAIAYGDATGTGALTAISSAARGHVYPAASAGSVDAVLTQVIGNF